MSIEEAALAAYIERLQRAANDDLPGYEKPPHWSETAARRGWTDEDAI